MQGAGQHGAGLHMALQQLAEALQPEEHLPALLKGKANMFLALPFQVDTGCKAVNDTCVLVHAVLCKMPCLAARRRHTPS